MAENRPLLAVLIIQFIYSGYFLFTKLAFDVGMNTFVFIFYRQAAATLFLLPIAVFFQRKTAPKLSFSIFVKIFMLSLFGITASLEIVGVAIKYTSASLGAATSNTLPVITFFLALLLRMEEVKIRTGAGMLKIAGVCTCTGGVAIIAFYRGPILKVITNHPHQAQAQAQDEGPYWIKGVFLLLLSNITWAFWLVLQGRVLKSYPSKLLLTTLQCLLSTLQSFVVAIAFAPHPALWKLGWNLRFLSVAYCGIVVTGVTFYLQAWVVEKKGPVFLAMTTPLIFLITIILSTFILGETIHLGSVLGAVLLVGGLYLVLWGKTREEQRAKGEYHPNVDPERACVELESKGGNKL